jgi:hypothetical protein
MTADQLRRTLDNEFGLGKWPKTYQVSPETYANACQYVFQRQFEQEELYWDTVDLSEQKSDVKILSIAVGKKNKGIMFKNVELIIERT